MRYDEYLRKMLFTLSVMAAMMALMMLSGCRTKKAITERMSIESIDTTKTEADSARTIHSVVESTENLQYTTDFGIIEFANEGGELMIDPDGNIKAHGVKAYRRRRAHHESEKKERSITNDSTRVSNRQANGIRNKVDAETTHEKRGSASLKWYQRIVYKIGLFVIVVIGIAFALRRTIKKLFIIL